MSRWCSPTGRGSPLKMGTVWVRIPAPAPTGPSRPRPAGGCCSPSLLTREGHLVRTPGQRDRARRARVEGATLTRPGGTWLIGRPLPTADAPHQAIGKTVGLAVFSSDALSSTAYATQEILIILALAGTAAFASSSRSRSRSSCCWRSSRSPTSRRSTPTRAAAAPTSSRATTWASSPAQIAGRGAADGLHPDRRGLDLVRRRADRLGVPGAASRTAWRSRSCWSCFVMVHQPARREGVGRGLRGPDLLLHRR